MSVHSTLEPTLRGARDTAFMASYLDSLTLVERLHRLMLNTYWPLMHQSLLN